MEGWSTSEDGSSLDDGETVRNFKSNNGWCFDLDSPIKGGGFDDSKERLRSLFDQVLSVFLKESSLTKHNRPIPALLGDGKPVDLFKLFWVVRKNGGYDAVSKNGLWGFVTEECGLIGGVMPSIKLIYVKYLNVLDRWLGQFSSNRSLGNGKGSIVGRLDMLSQELEAEFRGLLADGREEKKRDGELVKLKSHRNGNDIDFDGGNNGFYLSAIGDINKDHENAERNMEDDDDEKFCFRDDKDVGESPKSVAEKTISKLHYIVEGIVDDEGKKISALNDNDAVISAQNVINKVHDFSERFINGDDKSFCAQDDSDLVVSNKNAFGKVINKVHDFSGRTLDDRILYAQDDNGIRLSAKSVVEEVLNSQKRKRQISTLSEMLDWVIHVAKHSDDPTVGTIPECSKWKEHNKEELWVQALSARKAFLIGRHADSNTEESLLQKKQRMCPSMYEDCDGLNLQSTEKLRGSKRLHSSIKSQLCPCCNSCSASHDKVVSPHKAELENSPKETNLQAVETLPANTIDCMSSDVPHQKQVCVGPLFQAEVPEWTGIVFESDSKWLGTQMWPQDGKSKSFIELDPIGKGRQNPCSCQFPGSTECVRFHIAEKRVKLKLELGLLFYHWRFDRMGEEVSLSWTAEEEKRFKDVVRLNTTSPNKLWKNAFRFFPTKTREKMVSYYFNVFLVQRRSYQNRVTPKDINSDDDETEIGSVGGSFGREAIHVSGSKLLICTQNKQCTDWE
ncbi:unnamed protein product [Ilex paraguariensis]|uniref:ARID domain-containing protein n=1 Tax=Ilex paraguariensis TaxID=185542 RepID=A0ABC8SN51_9AQUA